MEYRLEYVFTEPPPGVTAEDAPEWLLEQMEKHIPHVGPVTSSDGDGTTRLIVACDAHDALAAVRATGYGSVFRAPVSRIRVCPVEDDGPTDDEVDATYRELRSRGYPVTLEDATAALTAGR